MAVAVVTRTVMARHRNLAPFAWESLRVGMQARQCSGYLAGSLAITGGLALWTMTLWQDGRSMGAFRDSGAHAAAMPKLAPWAKEVSVAGWRVAPEHRPGWEEALERFVENVRFPRVDNPHDRQLAQVVEVPRRALVQAPLAPAFHPAARPSTSAGL